MDIEFNTASQVKETAYWPLVLLKPSHLDRLKRVIQILGSPIFELRYC